MNNSLNDILYKIHIFKIIISCGIALSLLIICEYYYVINLNTLFWSKILSIVEFPICLFALSYTLFNFSHFVERKFIQFLYDILPNNLLIKEYNTYLHKEYRKYIQYMEDNRSL